MIVENEKERQRIIKANWRIIKANWRMRHRERAFAQNKITKLIASGKIIRPNICSYDGCDETSKIEAHHPDYSKPLIIMWLCRKCHLKHHENWPRSKNNTDITIKGSRMTHLDPDRIQKVYDFIRFELNRYEKASFAAMAEMNPATISNFIKKVEYRYKGDIKTSTFERMESVFLSVTKE